MSSAPKPGDWTDNESGPPSRGRLGAWFALVAFGSLLGIGKYPQLGLFGASLVGIAGLWACGSSLEGDGERLRPFSLAPRFAVCGAALGVGLLPQYARGWELPVATLVLTVAFGGVGLVLGLVFQMARWVALRAGIIDDDSDEAGASPC